MPRTKMSQAIDPSVTSIPQDVYLALDRLGIPGARLLLVGNQNYILSGKTFLARKLSDKTLALLQEQEWVTFAQRNGDFMECLVTVAGQEAINERKAARSKNANLVQLKLVIPA